MHWRRRWGGVVVVVDDDDDGVSGGGDGGDNDDDDGCSVMQRNNEMYFKPSTRIAHTLTPLAQALTSAKSTLLCSMTQVM